MADNYEKSRESIPTHPTPITIEERGAGTSIFTISNLFTESQCDSIVNYITKNSNLWKEYNKNINNVECISFSQDILIHQFTYNLPKLL